MAIADPMDPRPAEVEFIMYSEPHHGLQLSQSETAGTYVTIFSAAKTVSTNHKSCGDDPLDGMPGTEAGGEEFNAKGLACMPARGSAPCIRPKCRVDAIGHG